MKRMKKKGFRKKIEEGLEVERSKKREREQS